MLADQLLVLASTSPYRAELLSRLGMAFDRASPGVDEALYPGEAPASYVQRLAEEKAAAVDAPEALVIGGDQTAMLAGRILGKPGTAERAQAQLLQASGQQVTFLTGICLRDNATGRQWADVVPFTVTFRQLDPETVQRYVERDNPLDCAGSFKAEGLGVSLFQRMEGPDPTALVGLPLIRLVDFLRAAGVAVP